MPPLSYEDIILSENEVIELCSPIFGEIKAVKSLPGEIDFNFLVKIQNKKFLLKIGRPDQDLHELDFQMAIYHHLFSDQLINDLENKLFFIHDRFNRKRCVRLISWLEGALLSARTYKSPELLHSIGSEAGKITNGLLNFTHESANRNLDWDVAAGLWVCDYLHLFSEEKRQIVQYFIDDFTKIQPEFNKLRKSIVHNDGNDNNIVVSENILEQKCIGIIDFGDAVYTQTINDLAILLAYTIMDAEVPLEAASQVIKGYHSTFGLEEKELDLLYTLVAMRLIISVTKSAINKEKEPDNHYLQISDQSAWKLLKKWRNVHQNFAKYVFKSACNFTPCQHLNTFKEYAVQKNIHLSNLINLDENALVQTIDLSIDSPFIGHYSNYENDHIVSMIDKQVQDNNILVGGYGESRPLYITDAFQVKTNTGYENRTIHMGLDVWAKAGVKVYAIEEGIVHSVFNNDHPKDYGPTIILKHEINGLIFFTLYGHLSKSCLNNLKPGQRLSIGDEVGEVGSFEENGNWSPHLHFQIILDMLDCTHDYYGVSLPSLWPVYQTICPDPNLLFKDNRLNTKIKSGIRELMERRSDRLGRSLSVSYDKPLHIVRGQLQYLIDVNGQKFLDTVNNVAHVGHEHPAVIAAGKAQINLLNTNTRYLHQSILDYAEQLLKHFPPSLCVVHFVNSGSEANELAMRMAKAHTGAKDIAALEVGYHGNTQACIDVSSYKFEGRGGKGCPEHTHIIPLPDTFRGMYKGDQAGDQYAKHLENIIEDLHSKNRKLAAYLGESIVSCGGQIVLPSDFLKKIYEITRKHRGVCIADEVQTGFGRVGHKFWAYELFDVVPDIVTLGKPMGNGHPLAAVVCTKEIAESFANGMEFFNTFGGNPVSCEIGNSVLKVIEEENLQQNALEVGTFLKEELIKLQKKFSYIGDVRGEGLFLGIEFTTKDLKPLPELTSYVVQRMKEYRILMSIDGQDHNVLKIKPPLVFTLENARYTIDCLSKILDEISQKR